MDQKIEPLNTLYAMDRTSWRDWLTENFEKEKEVWLVFPSKKSGEVSISYNDAVEEALCFGWIDSTVRKLDDNHRIQRFTSRRNGSKYSRANIERLIWLEHQGMLHPKVRSSVLQLIREPYIFPKDIIEFIRSDERAWANYEKFPDEYKRIRIAYIDGARNRPEEFHKRLESFLRNTRENRLLGYGGIDKYFKFGNSEMKKEKGGLFMLESFKPIINLESKILILGTLPGPESIRKKQYYAHPRNQFWPIIYDVFDSEVQVEYEDKCNFLLKNKIALWDVVGKAKREGASDQSIRDVEPNDMNKLMEEYPGIDTIIFNGKKAEEYFKRYFPVLYRNKKCISVSSTSPITGRYIKSLSEKKSDWKNAILKGIPPEALGGK